MASDDDTLRVRGPPAPAGEPPEDAFAPGEAIGDYVVDRLLASGGQGSVYLATHRLLGRRAAVKVLRREFAASAELVARFLREARVVNRIRHPDIVDIYDVGTLPGGRPYCVMEFLHGRGLDRVVQERAPMAPAEAVALLAPLCGALQAAHQAGVVHRDVKASNVLVLDGDGPPRVKLLDFGIAKAVEPGEAGLTTVGQQLGTLSAMSPEQIVGQPVDARADVYALGVLLFQMLTGRPPFSAPDRDEVERMHLEAAPPRPSEVAPVPAALDGVVARCLAKAPEGRWPSVAALLEAARAALDASPARPQRRQPAVAVQVALSIAPEPDDEALLFQAEAADAAEAALRGAGFGLLVATAGTVLGVRLLDPGPAGPRAALDAAVALGRDLSAGLARPGVAVGVRVCRGEAEVRDGAGGPEVTGGPVCALPPGNLPEGLTLEAGVEEP